MTTLIALKQAPIIEFSGMDARGAEVAQQIREMNIPMIEAKEENRASMKRLRATLNKELGVFEDQRKMIHGKITEPYNKFKSSYEDNIKVLYTKASSDLRDKIAEVEKKMLAEKTHGLSDYFNGQNKHDFLTFNQVGLNIRLSASDKSLKTKIDEYLAGIDADVKSIGSMDNSIRVLGYYQRTLDLADSISAVNADIKREEVLERQRVAKEKADEERREREALAAKERAEREARERAEKAKLDAALAEERRIQAEKNAEATEALDALVARERAERDAEEAKQRQADAEAEAERLEEQRQAEAEAMRRAEEIHTMKFTVRGNIGQLRQIKQFMDNLGVGYE